MIANDIQTFRLFGLQLLRFLVSVQLSQYDDVVSSRANSQRMVRSVNVFENLILGIVLHEQLVHSFHSLLVLVTTPAVPKHLAVQLMCSGCFDMELAKLRVSQFDCLFVVAASHCNVPVLRLRAFERVQLHQTAFVVPLFERLDHLVAVGNHKEAARSNYFPEVDVIFGVVQFQYLQIHK